MGNWIYYNEESKGSVIAFNDVANTVLDHRFNISHGLEPMKENVFKYLVESILKSESYGQNGYICVAYCPTRNDGISAIQTSRPSRGEGFSVEIIVDKKSVVNDFTNYCKKGLSLYETIDLFRKVLVEYKYPDISGWIDITGMIHFINSAEGEDDDYK